MFFVALDYVLNKGAILREEKTSDLDGLAVPHFRGPHFYEMLRATFFLLPSGLEADLCTDAKVCNDVEDNFLEHCILR